MIVTQPPPLSLGYYPHKTPFTRNSIVRLLPELTTMKRRGSVLVEIPERDYRKTCSYAIRQSISAAQAAGSLPADWMYEVATDHKKGGVRIQRVT